VPEEINDFLVADVTCQVVDVVPGVNEDSLFSHDITEAGGGGDDPLKSRRSDRHAESINKPRATLPPKTVITSIFKKQMHARQAG